MLNNNAVQKLETPKPSTSLSANRMIKAFITNKNKPKVIMVTGKVKIISNGFTRILSTARTTATIIAPKYPSTVTPFNI